MSKSWDEKYARNKDKAKTAFDEAAPKPAPDFSDIMKQALDGLKDRRQGPEDRRKQDAHAQGAERRTPPKPPEHKAMEVLTGKSAPAQKQTKQGQAEHTIDRKRPAPPPPQLNMGGMRIAPMRAPQPKASSQDQGPQNAAQAKAKEQEKDQARERMRALLKQQREQSRERGIGRD